MPRLGLAGLGLTRPSSVELGWASAGMVLPGLGSPIGSARLVWDPLGPVSCAGLGTDSSGLGSTGLGPALLGVARLGPDKLRCYGLGWADLGWAWLISAELGCSGLGSAGLIRLAWATN